MKNLSDEMLAWISEIQNGLCFWYQPTPLYHHCKVVVKRVPLLTGMLLFNSVVPAAVNEDEIGPYWTPLGLVLRLTPDGKVEATDVHDDVSVLSCLFHH